MDVVGLLGYIGGFLGVRLVVVCFVGVVPLQCSFFRGGCCFPVFIVNASYSVSFYCCCVGNVVCGGFVVVCSLYLVRRFGLRGCASAAAFRLRFLVCRSSGPRVCISMAVAGRFASWVFFLWAFVRARNAMRCGRGPGHTRALRVPRAETRLTVYRAQQVTRRACLGD